ncbi:MAG: D-alanine--D-alanine ligase [Bacteroidales bacterium]|nr:D-alanine--D-alanine ligase [Bacteroidales bacterium]MCL2133544.1 D-alanine--D-alanine ligase [Bacteroidales bacterium]
MKKNIAVVYGGNSSEFAVSVNSGRQVAANIDSTRYNVYEVLLMGNSWAVQLPGNTTIEIDKSDFSFVSPQSEKVNLDAAFIVIHGTPGENGLLQSYLTMLDIPYTSSNAFVSTLTFNKYATKCFLRDTDVKMAKDVYISKGDKIEPEELVRQLGLPMFIKPNASGSSFGVSKVKDVKEIKKALEIAFSESDAVLVEEYISGRELQQGVFKAAQESIDLPVTEIIPENEFFDYEAKYMGKSQEITPADIPDELAERLTRLSSLIYGRLGCKGIVRIDYILHNDEIYFLEINTVPGMSEQSIVPQQLQIAGRSLPETFTLLLEDTLARR